MILRNQSKTRPLVKPIHTGAFPLRPASSCKGNALQDEAFRSPVSPLGCPAMVSRDHRDDSAMADASPITVAESMRGATISPISPSRRYAELSLMLPRLEDLHVQDKSSDVPAPPSPLVSSPTTAGTLACRRRQTVKPLTASDRNLYFQRFREASGAEARGISATMSTPMFSSRRRNFVGCPVPLTATAWWTAASFLEGEAAPSSPCESPVMPTAPRPVSDGSKDSPRNAPGPADRRTHCSGSRPVPIHLQYARSHLPVLAAIMMSEQVRKGT
ncbi:hypothetical protein ACCO45_006859 [Purpureocillium lilacinum]|uniref:Uncharacterized protein n=1 Tax=Purpureocillium lilacinum TaxID=33203 RepID=A0ACC4DS44_PURLI